MNVRSYFADIAELNKKSYFVGLSYSGTTSSPCGVDRFSRLLNIFMLVFTRVSAGDSIGISTKLPTGEYHLGRSTTILYTFVFPSTITVCGSIGAINGRMVVEEIPIGPLEPDTASKA